MPWTRAVAAINASRSDLLSGICSLAQHWAIATSIFNILSEDAGIT